MAKTDVIAQKRREARLTERQIAFTREVAKDPSSATAAAVRAGFSPRSAKRYAYELLKNETIKSILAQHFLDVEAELSTALQDTLHEMHEIVTTSKKKGDRIRAAKVLLNYAQIASNVLGLKISTKKEQEILTDLTPEQLLAAHEEEARKIRELIDSGKRKALPRPTAETPATADTAGTGEVSQ